MKKFLLLTLLAPASVGFAQTTRPAEIVQPDEKPPAESLPCFPGAIYRKAVSSDDLWTGIDTVVTLPTLITDPARVDEKTNRPLDNASCYIGGRAGDTEIDAGVSWEVIREADGSVSAQRKAFRPFWRNKNWHSGPAKPELYFYPGDTIRMVCWTESVGKLKFRVELLARAGEPQPQAPIASHEAEFDAPGFGPGIVQQFKRVSAIDQFKNEGRPAQATAARVEGAVWQRASLLRGPLERRPFNPQRFTDMRCPTPTLVKVTITDPEIGAEKIDLIGR